MCQIDTSAKVPKVKYIYAGVLLLLLMVSFFIGVFIDLSEPNVLPLKVVRYQLEISNNSHLPVKNAALSVFAPVKQIGLQTTKSINASEKFVLNSDKYGNQVLNFNLKTIAPFGKHFITITAEVLFEKNNLKQPLLDFKTEFLSSSKYIEKNNLKIITTAASFNSEGKGLVVQEKALNAHNWVANNMHYSGYQKRDLGAAYAIKTLKGDCTEYMYLNAALMRVQGVPNIPVAGFTVGRNKVMLNATSYHNWNYFFDGSELKLSDSQGRAFNEKEHSYIVFRVMAKDEIKSLSNTHRFSTSDKRLKVKLI